jgi:membrane-bound ClpP family serine protease
VKKQVKEYNIILYDYFVKTFGERIAAIIIIPSAIIILGIIGYGIMLFFGLFDLGDLEWIVGIGLILFIIIFSPNKK